MSVSNREGVVTLLWDIENFNKLLTHKIESPVYLSHSLDRTRWKISLSPMESNGDAYDISLSLTRCSSSKQEVHKLVLDCELSIIGKYGDCTLVSKQTTEHVFVENHTWSIGRAFVSRNDVFYDKSSDYIPQNVMHVRCKMWRSFSNMTLSELITSQTKFERSHFFWKIENFSSLKHREMKEIHVKNNFSGSPILSYRFYTDKINDEAIIEIKSSNGLKLSICCEILALNSTGELLDSDYNNYTLNCECRYKRFLTLSTLSLIVKNKMSYLPMDALSLQIDSFYWSSDVVNVPSTEKSDCQGKAENVTLSPRKCDQQSITETENTKVCYFKTEKFCGKGKCDGDPDAHKNLENFAQDMHGMYEEGLLSDFILCAGNKTFPVHKSILSARSPVFKTMFTTPLKEKDGKTLDIPDIDADTLHRMLLFVYSSEIADLEWDDAISLYFAADKYNIRDLKSITNSVLKAKLSVSNVCEILVHADLHEDQDLKSSAMEFLANHDDEILGNDNWKTFQKEHMPLTMEILSVLYTKMKKRLE